MLDIDAHKAPIIIDESYYYNVARMTVMWSVCSFGCYLLNFMNKYLEGTIYENNYVEVLAALIAVLIGSKVYGALGVRACFALSYIFCLVSGLLVYYMEADKIDVPLVYGTKTKEEAVAVLVPQVIFFAKLGS